MPLSEDEQRILSEIEQQLYQSDPALARDIADTTVYTHAYRNLKWSLLGFVVGLVALILTLGTSYLLAFGGFLVMLVSRPRRRAQRPPARPGGHAADDPVDEGRRPARRRWATPAPA